VVRLTGDCPLIDPEIIDRAIDHHLQGDFDYTTNALEPTFPDGLDVEVMRFSALKSAWLEAKLPSEHEHVTPFLYNNPERFKIGHLKNNINLSGLRWTVDVPDDFTLVTQIYELLYPSKPEFTTNDILQLLERHPELKTLNLHYLRNEGMNKSLQADAEFLRTHTNVDSI
jgi:spore coat polysaccharide biosynthesis protein SpsF